MDVGVKGDDLVVNMADPRTNRGGRRPLQKRVAYEEMTERMNLARQLQFLKHILKAVKKRRSSLPASFGWHFRAGLSRPNATFAARNEALARAAA